MAFDAFFFFDGNCREAVEFYAEVFGGQVDELMTYGEAPGGQANPADADRVIYCQIALDDVTLMFSDRPSGQEHIAGNNISLSFGFEDPKKVRAVFEALAADGVVAMPLGQTFFSPLYGMVTDKFGIIWQLGLAGQAES